MPLVVLKAEPGAALARPGLAESSWQVWPGWPGETRGRRSANAGAAVPSKSTPLTMVARQRRFMGTVLSSGRRAGRRSPYFYADQCHADDVRAAARACN